MTVSPVGPEHKNCRATKHYYYYYYYYNIMQNMQKLK